MHLQIVTTEFVPILRELLYPPGSEYRAKANNEYNITLSMNSNLTAFSLTALMCPHKNIVDRKTHFCENPNGPLSGKFS